MVLSSSQWFTTTVSSWVPKGAIWTNGVDDRLMFTPTSTGNQSKFTFSTWLKIAELNNDGGGGGGHNALLGAMTDSTNRSQYYVDDNFFVTFFSDQTGLSRTITSTNGPSSKRMEDCGSWYHMFLSYDSTVASPGASDIYMAINGEAITDLGSPVYPTQNTLTPFNLASTAMVLFTSDHDPGGWAYTSWGAWYASDTILLDGYAGSPSEFGEENSHGIWVPIDPTTVVTDNKGTNGCWLDYADSTDLGKDVSYSTLGVGTDNSWTATNINSTNVTFDRPADDKANSIGNYCVLDFNDKGPSMVLINGNLQIATLGTDNSIVGTFGFDSTDTAGFYWEVTVGSNLGTGTRIGLCGTQTQANIARDVGITSAGDMCIYSNENASGNTQGALTTGIGSGVTPTTIDWGNDWTTGDVIQVFVKAGNCYFGLNNSWQNTTTSGDGTPTTAAQSSITGDVFPYFVESSSLSTDHIFNFGASAFTYTPPVGAKTLNTSNLDTPAIKNPSEYFKVLSYEGTGVSNSQTLSFKPDLVWIKNRDAEDYHMVYDSVREATNEIFTNSDDDQETTAETLKSFDASGFTVGTDVRVNTLNETYSAYAWRAGGPPSTDNLVTAGVGGAMTDGSVYVDGSESSSYTPSGSPTIYPKKMSLSTVSNFSIIEYEGDGAATASFPHGLGVVPTFVLVKQTVPSSPGTSNWIAGHVTQGSGGDHIFLNHTTGWSSAGSFWNGSPDESLINIGTDNTVNESGSLYICYAWSDVPRYSRMLKYLGNNPGPYAMAQTNFLPAFMLIKKTCDTGNWILIDNAATSWGNRTDSVLFANGVNVQSTGYPIDWLASGIKIHGTESDYNQNNCEFVYVTFAENPLGGNGAAQAKAR